MSSYLIWTQGKNLDARVLVLWMTICWHSLMHWGWTSPQQHSGDLERGRLVLASSPLCSSTLSHSVQPVGASLWSPSTDCVFMLKVHMEGLCALPCLLGIALLRLCVLQEQAQAVKHSSVPWRWQAPSGRMLSPLPSNCSHTHVSGYLACCCSYQGPQSPAHLWHHPHPFAAAPGTKTPQRWIPGSWLLGRRLTVSINSDFKPAKPTVC